MDLMPVTKDQAQQITALTIAARPTGAPRWDHAGVMSALARVAHLDLAEVLIAAGRAARDRDLDTPAPIGNPAALCWIERPIERPVPTKTTPDERCGICSHPRHPGKCRYCPSTDTHQFDPDFPVERPEEAVRLTAAAVREELRAFGDRPTDEENTDA